MNTKNKYLNKPIKYFYKGFKINKKRLLKVPYQYFINKKEIFNNEMRKKGRLLIGKIGIESVDIYEYNTNTIQFIMTGRFIYVGRKTINKYNHYIDLPKDVNSSKNIGTNFIPKQKRNI